MGEEEMSDYSLGYNHGVSHDLKRWAVEKALLITSDNTDEVLKEANKIYEFVTSLALKSQKNPQYKQD